MRSMPRESMLPSSLNHLSGLPLAEDGGLQPVDAYGQYEDQSGRHVLPVGVDLHQAETVLEISYEKGGEEGPRKGCRSRR